ncbi:LPXTG cell wall anchor domain-containing protein [Neobacillus sp. D3-1R]|uniref:LPXTG cell wall anchor domain-containing protein n=1 Tax=Neobacillus sp. D3-1R TaxID=3445778 RepID=UPI003FA0E5CD
MKNIRLNRIISLMITAILTFLLIFPTVGLAKGSDNKQDHMKNNNQHKTHQPYVGHGRDKAAPKKQLNQKSTHLPQKNAFKNNHNSLEKNTPNKTEKKNHTTSSKNQSNTNKSTQIHLHLKNCWKSVTSVFVQWNGEWKQMYTQGNSPLYKLKDKGEYVKDDITGFKLMTPTGEVVVPIDQVRIGVEAQGTINYWLESCEKPKKEEESAPVISKPVSSEKVTPSKEVKVKPSEEKAEEKTSKGSNEKNPTLTGVLPKTGESSPIYFYLLGLLLASLGVFYLFRKRK